MRLNIVVCGIDAVHHLRAESMLLSLEHNLIFACGKPTPPISKETDWHRNGQINGSFLDWNVFFHLLYCAKSKLSATVVQRNKSPMLLELEFVTI